MKRSFRKSVTFRYGAAVGLSCVAYVLQLLIWPYIPPSPQLFFYPAIFFSAWLFGAGPGYVATLTSCFWMAEAFLPPEGLLVVADASDVLDLLIFAGVAAGISYVMGRLRHALRSERKAAEEARLARKAIEETWSMIAHDLRTPLSVIQLSSSDLERRLQTGSDAPDSARVERALQTIQRSTHRASDLVRDAVDAMRLANGVLRLEPAEVDVTTLCADAVEAIAPLAQKKSIDVSFRAPEHEIVACDAPRILQVLSNLLGNAVKFTPANGAVVLTAEKQAKGVRFAVSDSGVGIAEEELETVFAKFWTRDTSAGLGLGLWIARAIVEAHGGKLSVESRRGQGTTFSFVLGASAVSPALALVPARDVSP